MGIPGGGNQSLGISSLDLGLVLKVAPNSSDGELQRFRERIIVRLEHERRSDTSERFIQRIGTNQWRLPDRRRCLSREGYLLLDPWKHQTHVEVIFPS